MSKHKKYYNNGSKPSGYTPQNATPKKKQDKKDWTYWLVVIALAFTFIGSILGTVSFAKGCIEDYQQKNALSSIHSVEDIAVLKQQDNYKLPFVSTFDTNTEVTTYSFNSSNLYMPMARVNTSSGAYTGNSGMAFMSYTVGLVLNANGTYTFNFDIRSALSTNDNIVSYIFLVDTSQIINSASFPWSNTFTPTSTIALDSMRYYFRFGASNTSYRWQCYVNLNYEENGAITLLKNPITRIEISNRQVDWTDINTRNYFLPIRDSSFPERYYVNTVKYFQGNHCAIEFGFLTYSDPTVNTLYNDRIYYTQNETIIREDYQQGYDNGLIQGKQDGIVIGREEGYVDGWNDGRSDGYNAGYNAGVESANEFTFLGLFGALFDAPITALQGLLNFNLLGFNMFNFFTALLTIGLIIFIVRLFV